MSHMNRRKFLKGVGALAGLSTVGGAATACLSSGGGSGSDPKKLVVVDSGGTYHDASKTTIYDPFTKETGIQIEAVPYESTGTLMSQLQQSPGSYDVLSNSPLGAQTLQKEDLLAKIDYEVVGKSFEIDDLSAAAKGEYFVGSAYWCTVLAYRTDVFTGEGPKGWEDFWDTKKFPGPRSMQDNSAPVELEFALAADGVAADAAELYPIDVDRAFGSLDRIRPKIVKFWSSGALSVQLLTQKEVVMTTIWNGRAQPIVDEGAPVAMSWDGASRRMNAWLVPSGSEKVDLAMQFIDFASQPKRQAKFAELSGYGPTNSAAVDSLDEETTKKLPSNPEWFDSGFDWSADWWAKNEDAMAKRWSKWAQK